MHQGVDGARDRTLGELAHPEHLQLERLELLVKVRARHQPNLPVT
jgi:hypothetical protein